VALLPADGLEDVVGQWRWVLVHGDEIAAHEFERIPFFIDFPLCSHSEPPEKSHRRAPSLHGMLKKKRGHCRGQKVPAPVHQTSECQADKRDDRSVRFERSLDIPLAVQVVEPHVDEPAVGGERRDVRFRLPENTLIDFFVRMVGDPICRGRNEI